MFTISKEFSFEAAHHLKGLPPEHACSRTHGHSYRVIFTLRSDTLNEIGFVKDYRELDEVKNWINENLDHQDLNSYFDFNPTAEILARYLYKMFFPKLPQLISVTVKETDKTSATYASN